MGRRGYPQLFTNSVKIVYKSIATGLDLNGRLSSDIPTNNGVRQGCYLFPHLVYFIYDLLRAGKSRMTSRIQHNKSICVGSLLNTDEIGISRASE